MAPGMATTWLIYVSDTGTDDVYAINLSNNKLVGTLTGFSSPQGLCADKAGNVWVTDGGASDLVEYAHGAISPIKTLSDPGESPNGCAVYGKNGDLAVTNYSTNKGGRGSLAIYKAASGKPTLYSDPSIDKMLFDTYDRYGNVFVDGFSNSFRIAKFNGKSFTGLSMPYVKIDFPGAVQDLAGKINVEDEKNYPKGGMMYETTLSGTKLITIKTSVFYSAENCQQVTLYEKIVSAKTVTYALCPLDAGHDSSVLRYFYPDPPKMGPIGGFGVPSPFTPFGTAISP
jgi:hypothetical protein